MGSYTATATVTLTSGGPNLVLTQPITVYDAPLTAIAASVSGDSGLLLTNTAVATFTDGNTSSSLGDFTATITWDDGITSAGTITGSSGSYTVTATTFTPIAGSFPISVDVFDVGGSATEITSTATISGAISVQAVPFNATAATSTGQHPCCHLHRFGKSTGTPSDYTATINWGNGQVSTGTVTTNGSGGFNVNGSNTYGLAGPSPRPSVSAASAPTRPLS